MATLINSTVTAAEYYVTDGTDSYLAAFLGTNNQFCIGDDNIQTYIIGSGDHPYFAPNGSINNTVSIALTSDLGTQVTYSLSDNTLSITTK